MRRPWPSSPRRMRARSRLGEHQGVVAVEVAEVLGSAGHGLPGRAPQQLDHACRSLDRRHRRGVVTVGSDAVDDLAQRAERDRGLAQGGQHALDVAHEDAGGSDHEHAAALVAGAVGVEQEGGAVERDDGLAGAGSAADLDDALGRCPDRLVLLGLDGGHDGVHRTVARARQLGHEGTLAHDRQVGARLGVEQVVLDPDHRAARAAQDATAYDALGLRCGGLVEDRSRGGAPVDEQGVAVAVAQADATDVARGLGGVLQVEAAEDQALVGGVEVGDASRRLEDHGVALDEPALVSEPGAPVALTGQRLGVARGRLQLAVDDVDERLLVRGLARHEIGAGLTTHRGGLLRGRMTGEDGTTGTPPARPPSEPATLPKHSAPAGGTSLAPRSRSRAIAPNNQDSWRSIHDESPLLRSET